MARWVHCINCGRNIEHLARGMCQKCYSYTRERTQACCAECGEVKDYYARGLCRQCYDRGRPYVFIHCLECGRNKGHKGKGLCSTCYDRERHCYPKRQKWSKEYNEVNRERIKARHKKYYREHREEQLAYHRKRNKMPAAQKRKREYERRYRQEHLEQCKERSNRWKKDNPKRNCIHARSYYARKLGATIGTIDAQAIYERDGNKCVYCRAEEDLTLDHVIPLIKGGPHTQDNLVVACRSCNSSKGDRMLEEWQEINP